MQLTFEQNSWSRIDISPKALDKVETELITRGVSIETLDIKPHLAGYRAYLQLPAYAGEYRIYGGDSVHCLLEKSLEHYLTLALAQPMPGQIAIDVGSCKSIVPAILREIYQVRCFEQDLEYPSGVHGERIGSSADAIPLADATVDFMMLHCTFEHFEGRADTGFIRESARLLKPGGRTIIAPLYLNSNYCNITGETDNNVRQTIGFDSEAQFHCVIPEWHNRFGRHYSPSALLDRVIAPAEALGLRVQLLRCSNWSTVDSRLWLRWVLVLQKGI